MFNPGDTVVFDPRMLNPDYWDKLSETNRIKYYGWTGYPEKKNLFTFLCYHRPQYGHCILVDMQTQRILTMRHPDELRLAIDEEC